MKNIFKLTLLIVSFFVASFAFAAAPSFLIVHNNVAHPSRARVKGRWSSKVQANSTQNIPWHSVRFLCKYKTNCVGSIFVFLSGRNFIKAGTLKVNTKTGKLTVLNDVNGFNIDVNGVGEVTLSKSALLLG